MSMRMSCSRSAAVVLGLVGAGLGVVQDEGPPAAKRGSDAFEFHGTRVPDPYRWLEALGSERDAWSRAQDAATAKAFEGDPNVARFRDRILELNAYSRARVPRRAGGNGFTWGRVPGELYSEIRMRSAEERAEGSAPRLIVAPHDHPAAPGEAVTIEAPVPSPEGTFLLYGASSTSMAPCLRVMDVASGEDLPEDAVATNYWPWRVSWLADESGFAYVSGDAVRVHRLGQPVGEDPVVFRATGNPLPDLAVRAAADGSMLFVTAFHPTDDTTRVHARFEEGEDSDAPWIELFGEPGGSYQVLGKRGDRIFAYTTLDAPNGRILASEVGRPGSEHWVEVVPEHEHPIYDDNHPVRPTAGLFADRIALLYGAEGRLTLRVHDLEGELVHEVVHAELGFTESGLTGHPDEPFVRYDVQSLLDPGSAHEVDLRSGERRVIGRARTPFDPDGFTLYRRSYESDDGTRVPVFLAHRKGIDPKGAHAALINNWAGGGMVVRPLYLPELFAWIEAGGVLAVPAVRGSGEYGEAWHRAGAGPNKGTSIDDFGAAARWLVEEGIAGEGRVGLLGASMSGAATAGVLVRHADALGAALIQIPRVDLLAEPKWFEEYGDSGDPQEFARMMEWMPLPGIEVEARSYPPTLVQVGSSDPVAPPFHGYKLVAALQHAQTGPAPIHLQVAWGVGHNLGNGIAHQSETLGLQFAFLARALGLGVE